MPGFGHINGFVNMFYLKNDNIRKYKMTKIINLIKTEFKNIFRDQFLIFICILPIFIATLFRFAIPEIREHTLPYFDLAHFYDPILCILIILTPSFFGWVVGFIILDDRDEDILTYMSVTPIGKSGYIWFKILLPLLLSIPLAIISIYIANLKNIELMKLLPIIIIASLEAPYFALFLGTFANNKVEGLATAKLANIIIMGAFVPFFIKSNWAFLAGFLPTFWIAKAWLTNGFLYYAYILIGFIHHLLVIWLMLFYFNKKIK